MIDLNLRISQYSAMLEPKEIREELIRQLDRKKLKGKDVALHLGIAPARVTEMRNRDRQVQPDELVPLAKLLGMDTADLAIPEGAIPVMGIPLLGEVPGGPWQEAVHKSNRFIPAPQPGMPASAYALTVVGNSMEKIAKDGATIIIDPEDRDLFDKWLYVVRNGDGEVTFKQYRENPARLVPCSTDPQHKVIPIADRDYEIVGRVIWIAMRPDQAALD